ncbi:MULTISPECIES: NACHT domain-containing protein [Streptomyces violaceusniger group]|uniref:NACHT domain-containing protein n=1 Tax=Streptomyces javensis TaxID=114698 RepID=A0ABN1XH22_9ACTN|nr:NACHT domain-containing protein [Streptomyces javensis]
MVLVGGVVAGTGLTLATVAPALVIGLVATVGSIEVLRRRAGRRALREGPTHNAAIGTTVAGSLVQARTIGSVTISGPPRPSFEEALNDAADRLAESLRRQCREEEERRKIQDPIPLPVRWELAPDHVMDHWANICCSAPGAVPRPLSLSGQLDEIAEVFGRVPSKRLVVLGREGSGKTTLTIRFVLDLLAARTGSGDSVPVIFSLASWDPTTMTLRRWMAAQLERDHPGLAEPGPGLAAPGSGAPTLAAALVDNDRILPVLDGFDEIARGLHPLALERLNGNARMSLLLTSRRTEYSAAVAVTDVLTSAAAVELIDLSPADLDNYLPRTTRKATATSTAWDPVLRHLRDHPQHPASAQLAGVLTTPLMVALARTVYSDSPDRDPWKLLDTDRFSTPAALEGHLLDSFIPTVYRDQPPAYRERVPHWLGHLAQHPGRLPSGDGAQDVGEPGTRDLAWWQLGGILGRSSRMCVIGLVSGLAFGLVDWLVMWFVAWQAWGYGLVPALGTGLLNGVSFGSVSGLAFGLANGLKHGDAACEPSRVRVRLLGGKSVGRKEFASRLLSGLLGGFGFAVVVWLVDVLLIGLTQGYPSGFAAWVETGLRGGLLTGLLYGPSAGLVFTIMAMLEAPIDIESVVTPFDLLRVNRTAVLIQLLAFGLVLGTAGGILHGCGNGWFGIDDWIAFGAVGGLGGGLAYGLGLTAWGQWVALVRIWLPLTGRLPWAVGAFLEDAHRRGVLRQTGAVYQFRHARLQDRLAGACRSAR